MSNLNVGEAVVGSELNLPIHTNSSRPTGAPPGHMIFNQQEGKIQIYDGSDWISIGSTSYDISATGDVTTTDLGGDFAGDRVIKFTGDGTLTVNNASSDKGIDLLIIGGGGGGGGVIGGGGGAGGTLYKRNLQLPVGTYQITIGSGGLGGKGWNQPDQEGRAGQPTTFIGGDIIYEAVGGGGGEGHGGNSGPGYSGSGGCGGGSANKSRRGGSAVGNAFGYIETLQTPPRAASNDAYAQGAGVLGSHVHNTGGNNNALVRRGIQGWPGGSWGDGDDGAGGGGCGYCGTNGGAPRDIGGPGGPGCYMEIEGTLKAYAGGGGGGVRGTGRIRGEGGVGGGGQGGRNTLLPSDYGSNNGEGAENGQVNTGGGGGGGGYNGGSSSVIGGTGGPGVVIVRYTK